MYLRVMIKLCVFILTVFLIGCSDHWKAKVESNTSWSGSFNGTTVDGHGNQTVDLGNDDIVCCVVQKQTTGGRLKVSIVNESNNPLGSGDGESKETTAQYGVVSVCNE